MLLQRVFEAALGKEISTFLGSQVLEAALGENGKPQITIPSFDELSKRMMQFSLSEGYHRTFTVAGSVCVRLCTNHWEMNYPMI